MEMELKPCPFCGRTPTMVHAGRWFAVVCACDVMIRMCSGDHDSDNEIGQWWRTEDDAAEAWNRRAADALLREAVEVLKPLVGSCQKCGGTGVNYYHDTDGFNDPYPCSLCTPARALLAKLTT